VNTVTDTARVLLTAAVLSGITMAAFAWRVMRTDPSHPDRLVGELRLAQWAAVLLAGIGAIPIGAAIVHATLPFTGVDAAIGVIVVGIAGLVLQRPPREALLLATGGFLLHALVNLAHRPGWLAPDLAPRWWTVGCAIYDVLLAAICYGARHR
jgi:hypothetical protein